MELARKRINPMTGAARRGFTLVELLVVVSIIALLIAILLPSLKSAREQAKTVKCQAGLRQIMTASITYQNEANEFLPGSPGTTGGVLVKYGNAPEDLDEIPEPPIQTWDWAGPLAATQMEMTSVPRLRSERWKMLISDVFLCPSNRIISQPFLNSEVGPHGNFFAQRMVSYNTVRNFLMWPTDGRTAPFSQADGFGNNGPASWSQVGGTTDVPSSFVPQVNKVGQPSEKIYIADGSRFTTDDGEVDHNISWKGSAGGAFADGGPTLPDQFLRSYMRTDPARKLAYRHSKGNTFGLAVGYFDGHAGWISENESRFPDAWWPKGTELPRGELNRDSQEQVRNHLDSDRIYRVRR